MDRDDVDVVEGGDGLGFALEAFEARRIAGESGGEQFESDIAFELQVPCAIDLAHAPLTQELLNPMVAEDLSRLQSQDLLPCGIDAAVAAADGSLYGR